MSEQEPKYTGIEFLRGDNLVGNYNDFFSNDVSQALQLKYPSMDFEMNGYMERSDNNDPTCICVDMDDGKRIDFSRKIEGKDEVIFTVGLCGCIATALVLEMNDGRETVILTHNSPLTTRMGSGSISRLGADIKREDIKNAKVFILAPSEWILNSEGKYEQVIQSERENETRIFELSAKIVGGANTQVERIGYSELLEYGKKNQGTFRIVKGKDGKIKFIVENFHVFGDVFP